MGEDEYYYVFTFVGVIVVAGHVLKCYPKYLLHSNQLKEELRQVLKVLEKYNTKEQIVRMFNDSSESSAFNLLAVLLFLLQDYFENGVYNNTACRGLFGYIFVALLQIQRSYIATSSVFFVRWRPLWFFRLSFELDVVVEDSNAPQIKFPANLGVTSAVLETSLK